MKKFYKNPIFKVVCFVLISGVLLLVSVTSRWGCCLECCHALLSLNETNLHVIVLFLLALSKLQTFVLLRAQCVLLSGFRDAFPMTPPHNYGCGSSDASTLSDMLKWHCLSYSVYWDIPYALKVCHKHQHLQMLLWRFGAGDAEHVRLRRCSTVSVTARQRRGNRRWSCRFADPLRGRATRAVRCRDRWRSAAVFAD